MPSTGPRAKHWCFTMNNYTPEDLDRLSSPIPGVQYLIFGKEVGSSGTPHLQGTVCFQSRKRLKQVTDIIGQAHCSVTRYLSQSIEYCKKDGEITEWGEKPNTGKKGENRSDLEEFKQSVKEGITDLSILRELHSGVCARYPRFVLEYIEDNKPPPEVSISPRSRESEETLPSEEVSTDLSTNSLSLFPRLKAILFGNGNRISTTD